jgi:DNA-binding CsgD family transcriptional regulator
VPLGRPDEGLDCIHRSLEIATELGILDDVARAYVNLTHSLSQLGRWDELIEVGHEGIDQATRLGLDRTFGVYVESNLLDALVATGAWDEAEERAASIPTRLPVGYWEYFAPSSIFADRGDFGGARELADRLREVPEESAAIFQGLADYTLGAMALAIWEHHPEQVAPLMEVVLDRLPDAFLRWRSGELLWRATWAEADRAARGRGARDEAEVAAAIATADRWHEWVESLVIAPADGALPSASLLAHAPLCSAERARADETDQPDDWERAIEPLDRFGLRYQVAYARFRRAESILRTGGDRALAAAELAAARATTVELRARPLTAEIDQLAKRGRLGPSEPDDDDAAEGDDAAAPLGLSPRERQVLQLVADGATNRQIAERLYISPKTASVHVSNILAKLGVASRGEAAAVAHRLGVTVT